MADEQLIPTELEKLLAQLAGPLLGVQTEAEPTPKDLAIQTTIKAAGAVLQKVDQLEQKADPEDKVTFSGHQVYYTPDKGWQRTCPHKQCDEPVHDIDRDKILILAAMDISLQILRNDEDLIKHIFTEE